jgi:HSP20 family protein
MSSMSRWPSMFTGWPGTAHAEMPFATLMNAPKAAMSESESDYELTVELPGLDEKEIELTLSENALILKGEKKAEKSSKDKDYHFTERSYGTVRRSFSLPPGVNREAMKASFSKGVLTVTLPKTHEAEGGPRRIEVSGA